MEKLRIYIDSSGTSMSQVALKFGVAPTNLSYWLRGHRSPEFWVGIRLANFINADLNELQTND